MPGIVAAIFSIFGIAVGFSLYFSIPFAIILFVFIIFLRIKNPLYFIIFVLSFFSSLFYFKQENSGFGKIRGTVLRTFGKGYIVVDGFKRVFTYIDLNEEIETGDVVEIEGEVCKPKKYIYVSNGINLIMHNSKVLNIEERNNLLSIINSIRKKIYLNMIDLLGYEDGNVVAGLTIGRVIKTSSYIEHKFKRAGLIHLLAVSGLHIGALLLFSLLILKIMGMNKDNFILKLIIIVIPVLIYSAIAGFRHSVIRASITGIMLGMGFISGKYVNFWNSLGHALWINLIIYPWAILSPGFQLSYLAVISIFITISFLPAIKNNYLRWIIYPVVVSTAIQLFLIPLLLIYFKGYSPVSPITNLLCSFFISLLVPVSLLLSFVSLIYKPVLIVLYPFVRALNLITSISYYITIPYVKLSSLIAILLISSFPFIVGLLKKKLLFVFILLFSYLFIVIITFFDLL